MKSLSVISVLFIAIVATTTACAQQQEQGDDQRQDRRGPPAFTVLDLDADGGVTLEEFKQQKIPHGDHATIFNAIDSNNDGVISEAELKDHKPPQRGGRKSK
ncbi:EF-hand domain-containing protein [Dasania marina]|mgnify:CR=1 FL=1|uniref:EF-hand domain-containing protein n=1 Tax=Dasania marina TaxID=471499 RepID=UPI0030D79648|tara:strand:+ start:260 stop:565 length:306 start_codon:yes stop_codon:yes gene_type:complete